MTIEYADDKEKLVHEDFTRIMDQLVPIGEETLERRKRPTNPICKMI